MFTRIKQLRQRITGFIHHIRFTQARVITGGMILLALLLLAILGWDTSLFLQSLSPLEPAILKESKQVTLAPSEIDDADRTLDLRQQQFNALLQSSTGTSTISF